MAAVSQILELDSDPDSDPAGQYTHAHLAECPI